MYQTGVPRPSETLPGDGRIRTVACDTETSGLHGDDGARVSIVSVSWLETVDGLEQQFTYAYPFDQGAGQGGKEGVPVTLFDEVERDEYNLPQSEWDLLLDWLARQRLVFHNAKFDLAMLRIGTRSWAGRDLEAALWWDTMVTQKEIDPGFDLAIKGNLKLKPVSTKYRLTDEIEDEDAHEKRLKAWLTKNKRKVGGRRYDLAPWDLIGPYASQDARLTILLYRWQLEAIDQGLAPPSVVQHRHQVLHTLYRMEKRGVGYDAAASLAVADQIKAQIRELEKALPFRNTLPAAKQFFFTENRSLVYKTTPGGAPALDDDTLRKMVNDQVQWAKEYSEIKKLETAVSMWYQGYPEKMGPDGRLRTEFQQTKVKSGRMSSTRTNLQAVPKEDKTLDGLPSVRSFFRARDGYRLWNCDLQQAELRVASKYARCKLMMEMLLSGEDLHAKTAIEVIGADPSADNWKSVRDIAKRLNFGGIFLIGGRTFQATLSKEGIYLPLDECDEICAGFRVLYSEYGRAYRQSENQARTQGSVLLMPGTPYQTRSRFGPLDYPNTAWSRRVQGSLAEYVGLWLTETEDLLEREGGSSRADAMVLTVHDSIVLELPDDGYDEEWANRIADLGARRATELFDFEMKVDTTPWHGKAA